MQKGNFAASIVYIVSFYLHTGISIRHLAIAMIGTDILAGFEVLN